MPYLKNLGLLFLFAALVCTSCRKNDEEFGVFPPSVPVPEVIVNGSFSGVVTDEYNIAVDAALVSFGTETRLTDENGYFAFRNVEINTKGSLVSVDKDGYFHGAKFVSSRLNKQNFTTIKLIEKVQTGSFQTGNGGTVTTNDGATIAFAANSIEQEGGGSYSGTIKVYASWLDPTAADLTQRMPGDLRALNTANEQQQLTTYGMIGVELEGEAGEVLNIAKGQTATITLPLPAELAAGAPTTIPLWHFDEVTGYWIEEGEALLQGGAYVGTVSHFSFWNCDVPSDFIFLEGTVTDRDLNPLPNVTIKITVASSGMAGYGITDEDGAFGGFVPNDQELIITIIDNCGEEVYSSVFGPFSEDTVLPNITTSVTDEFVTVSGILVDCESNPVSNGYLKIDIGSSSVYLPTDADGMVNGTINLCGALTVTVTGYDLDNLTQSQPTNEEVEDVTALDFPSIFVCEDLSEFLILTVDGVELLDPDPNARFTSVNGVPGFLILQGNEPIPGTGVINVIMYFLSSTTGTYTPDFTNVIYFDDTPQVIDLQCDEDAPCDDFVVEVTTYGAVGEFIIGSFSGNLDPNAGGMGTTQFVEGTFKIIREE